MPFGPSRARPDQNIVRWLSAASRTLHAVRTAFGQITDHPALAHHGPDGLSHRPPGHHASNVRKDVPLKPIAILSTALLVTAISGSLYTPGLSQTGQERDRARPDDQRENDIALLLGLRADQMAALRTILKADRPMPPPPHGGPEAGHDRGTPQAAAPLPAMPDPLTDMEHHLEKGRERLTAIRTFRASLNEDQQRRFDALMRMDGVPGRRFGPPPPPAPHSGPGPQRPESSPPR